MKSDAITDSGGDFPAEVAALFSRFPQVRAIALGGSYAAGVADSDSDFDIYIYNDARIPIEDRAAIAAERASYAEVGNQTWGEGDEWISASSGQHVDLIYFDPDWMVDQIARVLDQHQGSVGYSTCFWHTVRNSKTLYDPHGWFAALHERAQAPYPEALRRDIIARNHPILRQPLASYRYQFTRAISRNDVVSVNHRVAGFLASVFDIIFALNRMPHPGEKRLAAYVRDRCPLVPPNFQSQLSAILSAACSADPALLAAADSLLEDLDDILRVEGMI